MFDLKVRRRWRRIKKESSHAEASNWIVSFNTRPLAIVSHIFCSSYFDIFHSDSSFSSSLDSKRIQVESSSSSSPRCSPFISASPSVRQPVDRAIDFSQFFLLLRLYSHGGPIFTIPVLLRCITRKMKLVHILHQHPSIIIIIDRPHDLQLSN